MLERSYPASLAFCFPSRAPSLRQPTSPPALVPGWGWRETQTVQSCSCIMQPHNISQSFRKFDKLEYVFRFLNSETFQSKGDLAASSRWLQMVLLFCVWWGYSCHWNTAVYRVCEGEYAENVNVSGLLLFPSGKDSSLACKFPMWEQTHWVQEEFIKELQRVQGPDQAQCKPGTQCVSGYVLFSSGCSNKWPQTGWLKTTAVCSLTDLERDKDARSEVSGPHSVRRLQGTIRSCLSWHLVAISFPWLTAASLQVPASAVTLPRPLL